jgi:hypothetical protein
MNSPARPNPRYVSTTSPHATVLHQGRAFSPVFSRRASRADVGGSNEPQQPEQGQRHAEAQTRLMRNEKNARYQDQAEETAKGEESEVTNIANFMLLKDVQPQRYGNEEQTE